MYVCTVEKSPRVYFLCEKSKFKVYTSNAPLQELELCGIMYRLDLLKKIGKHFAKVSQLRFTPFME